MMARLRRGSREPRPFLMRSRPILGALGSTRESREVALAVGVAERPGERVRVLGRLGLLVLALDDAEERGEQRQRPPVGGLEVRVEVPPLGRRRAMRKIVDREIDRAGARPILR